MSIQSYYSHGKLMMCGEYAVLGGATAFALPTKSGQSLQVEYGQNTFEPKLYWKAVDKHNATWFEAQLSLPHMIIESCSNLDVAIQLVRFLINAQHLNPDFLKGQQDVKVETRIEFELDEGLGSSSTLTNNIAQWAQVNPYALHFNAFKGSGFDIAVAIHGKALLYTMNGTEPGIELINWNKSFRDQLYLVHLNQKQNSRAELAKHKRHALPSQIAQISRISKLISANDDYFEFCLLLELAENETSQILGVPPIKQERFSDFHGSVKSLGAWGGDYVLATGQNTVDYFQQKGYHRIVPFNDIVL